MRCTAAQLALSNALSPSEARASPTFRLGLEPGLGIGVDVDSGVGQTARLVAGLAWGRVVRFGPELSLAAGCLGESQPLSASAGARVTFGSKAASEVFAHVGVGSTEFHGVQLYWDAGGALDLPLSDRWSFGGHARVCGLLWEQSKSALGSRSAHTSRSAGDLTAGRRERRARGRGA